MVPEIKGRTYAWKYLKSSKENGLTEAMRQVIAQAAIEAAKATLLAINEEGRKQSMIAVYNSASRTPGRE